MPFLHRPENQLLEARFEAFYRENYERVSLYVARRVAKASVDDVVSASFTVAWKKFSKSRSPSLPWVYRIASYEVSNHHRNIRRHTRVTTLIQTGELPNELDGTEFDGSDVVSAMHRLSENDREVLRLIHWEGLSRKEAAEVLEMSVNAVNVRYHRALKRLDDQMTPTRSPRNNIHESRDRDESTTDKEVLS